MNLIDEICVETNDWSDETSAKEAESKAYDLLYELSEAEYSKLLAQLKKSAESGEDYPPLADAISAKAFQYGIKGWASVPQAGHVVALYASCSG